MQGSQSLSPTSKCYNTYPQSSSSSRNQVPLSQVLPNLYLGTESDVRALTATKISEFNISNIISVQEGEIIKAKTPAASPLRSVKVMHVKVRDAVNTNLLEWFDQCNSFIESARGATVVHCQAGISRSASVCLAYLIKTKGYTLDEAFEFLKSKRNIVGPNFGFLGQLKVYETKHRN